MNPEYPTDPRQALEVSLTALLLGELPPDQAQFLRETLVRDAELARMHERLKRTIELVRQVEAEPIAAVAAVPEPLRLSETKRDALLEHFKTAALPEVAEPRRSQTSWWVMAAAAVVICLGVASMLMPALSRAKSKSQHSMAALPSASAKFGRVNSGSQRHEVFERDIMFSKEQATAEEIRKRPEQGTVNGVSPDGRQLPPAREMARANIVLPVVPPSESAQWFAKSIDESAKSVGDYDNDGFVDLFVASPGVAMRYESAPESKPLAAAETPPLSFGSALTLSAPAPTPAPPEGAAMAGPAPTENFRLGWAGSRAGGTAGFGGGGGAGLGGGLPAQPPPTKALAQDAANAPAAAFSRRYGLARPAAPRTGAMQQGLTGGAAVVPAEPPTPSAAELPKLDTYNAWALSSSGAPTAQERVVAQGQAVDPATGLPMTVTDAPMPDFQNRSFVAGHFVTTNAVVAAQNDADHLFTLNDGTERFAGDAVRGTVAKGKVPVLGDIPTFGRLYRNEMQAQVRGFYDDAPGQVVAQAEGEKNVAGTDYFYSEGQTQAGKSVQRQITAGISADSGGVTLGEKFTAADVSSKAKSLKDESHRLGLIELKSEEAEQPLPTLQADKKASAQLDVLSRERLTEQHSKEAAGKSADAEAAGRKQVAADEEGRARSSQRRSALTTVVPRVSTAGGKPSNSRSLQEALRNSGDTAAPVTPSRGRAKGTEVAPAQQAAADVAPAKPAVPPPVPQPEVATAENAFSTFSLNVSDVSFRLAAASLERGAIPDAASIRSEEFINAFDYRDPQAAPGMPLAFASERARYPFAQNRDLLRFSIKTAAQGRPKGRPLNLVLLVDNSGSMERSDRVSILREALRVLAAQLQPQDKLSVVAFSLTPHLWADGVTGTDAARVAEEVANLTPQGGTNLEEAMRLAYKTAGRHYLPNGINRVVILTDGAANLGNVDPGALKKSVEDHRKQGIALDCFGVGWEGYNDDLLEVLSRNGDGRYGFLNTAQEASTEFAGQLAGALRVAASDVKVQVEFNPKRVTAYRQIGYAKHQLTKEQFRDNTVDAAEIGAAESGNALYLVEVNPQGEGALATVRARYKVPGTTDYYEHEWTVAYNGSAPSLESASPAMRLAATAAAFSEWLATSPYAAGVTPEALLSLLRGVPQVYGADARPQKLEWMIRQAGSLGK